MRNFGSIAGEGFPERKAIVSSIGFVLTTHLDLLWISRYGVLGAAWATSVSYAVMTLLTIGSS